MHLHTRNTGWCRVLQYVALCCSVLQCVAVCCGMLSSCKIAPIYIQDKSEVASTYTQHTSTHCNTRQHTATHCNTLHTGQEWSCIYVYATHCNTLQRSATQLEIVVVLLCVCGNMYTLSDCICAVDLMILITLWHFLLVYVIHTQVHVCMHAKMHLHTRNTG